MGPSGGFEVKRPDQGSPYRALYVAAMSILLEVKFDHKNQVVFGATTR